MEENNINNILKICMWNRTNFKLKQLVHGQRLYLNTAALIVVTYANIVYIKEIHKKPLLFSKIKSTLHNVH